MDFPAKDKVHSLCSDILWLRVRLSCGCDSRLKAVMSMERTPLYELLVHYCLSYLSTPPSKESDFVPQVLG